MGIAAEQSALVWAFAAKEDDDWVKKCMEYEVEGPRPRGRPKKDLDRGCTRGMSST